MGALQDSFVQKANSTDQNGAADLLNGMSMPDMLAAIAALGPNGPIVCNNIVGLLRKRGWIDSAQRIEWAGQVVQRREIPNPPPGLAADQVDVARRYLGRPNANGKYTDSAQEIPCTRTRVTGPGAIAAIKVEWPSLSEEGVRTLASQLLFETAGGEKCFNWNLGGTKAKDTEPHFYMTTFECWPAAVAKNELATGGRQATPGEARNWRCKDKKVLVIYDPPHPMTRFRSATSLQTAAHIWVGHHQFIASKNSGYVGALNRGDIPAVIQVLTTPPAYFTGAPSDYQAGMQTWRAIIDQTVK